MGFKGNRTAISKTGVESGAIIKGFDVVKDGGAGLGEGSEALVIDDFVFETAPEGLDEGVVVAIAFATHGSDQTVLGQDLPISGAGKLHAAIGMDEQACFGASLEKRHTQSGDDQAGINEGAEGVSPFFLHWEEDGGCASKTFYISRRPFIMLFAADPGLSPARRVCLNGPLRRTPSLLSGV